MCNSKQNRQRQPAQMERCAEMHKGKHSSSATFGEIGFLKENGVGYAL
jgi:hypothetical protein